MPYFAAATVGLGVAEGISGASSARDEARANLGSIDEQIALLNKQREELGRAFSQKKEIATDMFGNKVESLNIGFDFARSKTDLVYSGTIEQQYGLKKENLYDSLGQSLLDIEMQQATQFGQIDTSLTGLRGERKIQDERAQERYLGIF